MDLEEIKKYFYNQRINLDPKPTSQKIINIIDELLDILDNQNLKKPEKIQRVEK